MPILEEPGDEAKCRLIIIATLTTIIIIIPFTHNRWTEAAFNGSVKAGNDEIVNYFLQNFPDETSDLKV